jgi:hypothetical protein
MVIKEVISVDIRDIRDDAFKIVGMKCFPAVVSIWNTIGYKMLIALAIVYRR